MKKVIRILIPLVIVLLIIMMAIGTVVESRLGSAEAISRIYHSATFVALWSVLIVLLLIRLVSSQLYRRPIVCMLHLSVVVIFIGAMLTGFTSQKGSLVLLPQETVNTYVTDDGSQHTLPFDVTLTNFEVIHYAGTRAPMDFVAQIQCDGTNAQVSMNHIVRHQGYRFYMNDYDDTGAVTLLVAHDPWGISVSYTGFALMVLSMLLFFFDKQSAFRQSLTAVRGRSAAVILLLLLSTATAATAKPRTLPRETADAMGRMYVLYQDRICPLQTLARDFTYQLYGSSTYEDYSAEQVLAGWIFYFQDWEDEPMFRIKGRIVRDSLGIEGRYASLSDYLDVYGQNRVGMWLDSMTLSDPRRARFSEANRKYNLLVQLYNGQLLKIFPHIDSATSQVAWFSQSDNLPVDQISDREYIYIRKQLSYCQELALRGDMATLQKAFEKHRDYQVKTAGTVLPSRLMTGAERLYNSIAPGRPVAIICIVLGLFFFACALVQLDSDALGRRHSQLYVLNLVISILLAVYLAVQFILRWLIGGHVPLSGGYETLLFMAFCVVTLSLLLRRKFTPALAVGLLMTGFVLLAAMIEGVNPPVTHLMPVLKSPLLLIHVAILMFAYTLLMFTLFNSIAALVCRWVRHDGEQVMIRLMEVSQMLLLPAVFLLTIGVIVGSVWANVSWGSYWSWDPKEVWALITVLIYAAPLHGRSIAMFRKPLAFHLYVLCAFLSVIITYFGVNLLLGGLHSYA